MKCYLHILSFLFGLAMLVACSKPTKVEVPEPVIAEPCRSVEGPTLVLSQIDTLMWHHPDSALAVMMEFAASPEADSMDVFEGHYCQVLVAELLFKNDYGQSNREEVLKAVAYFDSLNFTLNDIPHASRRHCGLDPQSPNQNDNIVFLSARAHYINGVGLYERDSVVAACGEYLKALEIMETHFPNLETQDVAALQVEHLPRFMSLTYSRLVYLFSGQFIQEPAIVCCKKALVFCKIEPNSPFNQSRLLLTLGVQYDKLKQYDSATYYYNEAIRMLPDTNNLVFRNLVSQMALLNFNMGNDAELSIQNLKRMVTQAIDESERLTRYLTIGVFYADVGPSDSALKYLTPVYMNKNDDVMVREAARCLHEIYQSKGDTVKASQFAVYLAENTVSQGKSNAQVSQLNELFQWHLQWEQERAEAERQQAARLRRNRMIVVVSVLVAVAVLLAWLLIRRRIKQQRDAASQQMEAVQEAHRLEKASMSGRLKRSNEELRELKDQIRQQNDTAPKPETQAASFAEEPICQLIMQRVNEGQFKSKVSYLDYSDYALSKEQITALREAADRHFGRFTIRLAKAYPDLTKSDLNYCCLYLLDLNDADIAALMQRAYNTVSDRSRKLKTLFGSEEPLSTILRGLATKEQFH